MNPADHQPRRIGKADKDFPKTIDFKDINFLVKTIDIQKIENKKCIGISVFGYENWEKYPIYEKNNIVKKNILTYYCLENEKKSLCSYQKILTDSCMIIYYFAEEDIFVVIVYVLSL